MRTSRARKRVGQRTKRLELAALGSVLAVSGAAALAVEAPAVSGAVSSLESEAPAAPPRLRLAQLAALDATLSITLPPPPRQQLLARAETLPPGPLRIGFHRDLPVEYQGDLTGRLRWVTDPEDGSVTAAVTVTSPEALGVRMAIRAKLPPGAAVRFFRGPAVVVGTLQHERVAVPSGSEGQSLHWSPSVGGDTIGLEITLPSRDAVERATVEVDRVAHRFRASSPAATPRDGDPSGSLRCTHVRIACENVGTIANAVAHIHFERQRATYICSGTLMNATNQALTPYFLTARHCISTQTVANTLEAHWFDQYRRCSGSTLDSRFAVTSGGASLLAASEPQDSTLLRLRRPPPGDAAFAGWTSRVVASGVFVEGIHHPRGYDKKYMAGNTERGAPAKVCGDPDTETGCFSVVDALPVRPTTGATEVGSSGSGLFIGEQLVGVLSGGEKECDRPSLYGRFSDFFPKARPWLAPDSARKGRVTVRPTTLEIPEGATRAYTVSLDIAPVARVTVTMRRTGDQDIAPQRTTASFTPQDWRPWRIDVLAREDADTTDGSATITHEARTNDAAYQRVRVASVTVRERDNDHPPAQVTGVSARPTGEPGEIRVTWNSAAGAEAYIVEWRQRSQGFAAHRRRVVRSGTATVLPDLDGDATYIVRVTATRDGLRGEPSSSVSFVAEGQLRRFLRGWRLELFRPATTTPSTITP